MEFIFTNPDFLYYVQDWFYILDQTCYGMHQSVQNYIDKIESLISNIIKYERKIINKKYESGILTTKVFAISPDFRRTYHLRARLVNCILHKGLIDFSLRLVDPYTTLFTETSYYKSKTNSCDFLSSKNWVVTTEMYKIYEFYRSDYIKNKQPGIYINSPVFLHNRPNKLIRNDIIIWRSKLRPIDSLVIFSQNNTKVYFTYEPIINQSYFTKVEKNKIITNVKLLLLFSYENIKFITLSFVAPSIPKTLKPKKLILSHYHKKIIEEVRRDPNSDVNTIIINILTNIIHLLESFMTRHTGYYINYNNKDFRLIGNNCPAACSPNYLTMIDNHEKIERVQIASMIICLLSYISDIAPDNFPKSIVNIFQSVLFKINIHNYFWLFDKISNAFYKVDINLNYNKRAPNHMWSKNYKKYYEIIIQALIISREFDTALKYVDDFNNYSATTSNISCCDSQVCNCAILRKTRTPKFSRQIFSRKKTPEIKSREKKNIIGPDISQSLFIFDHANEHYLRKFITKGCKISKKHLYITLTKLNPLVCDVIFEINYSKNPKNIEKNIIDAFKLGNYLFIEWAYQNNYINNVTFPNSLELIKLTSEPENYFNIVNFLRENKLAPNIIPFASNYIKHFYRIIHDLSLEDFQIPVYSYINSRVLIDIKKIKLIRELLIKSLQYEKYYIYHTNIISNKNTIFSDYFKRNIEVPNPEIICLFLND